MAQTGKGWQAAARGLREQSSLCIQTQVSSVLRDPSNLCTGHPCTTVALGSYSELAGRQHSLVGLTSVSAARSGAG